MIVLDTNAAFAIARGTGNGEALAFLRQPDEEVIAPDLFHSELVHTLVKYVHGGVFDTEEALDVARDAIRLVDRFVSDDKLWAEALSESIRYRHSSYDMFYMLLARREGATLFTLDRKLQKLCDESGVSTVLFIEM